VNGRIRALLATALAAALAFLLGPHVDPLDDASAATAAGDAWGWGRAAEVGDWEMGESTAGWKSWADGTGRAAIYYGQIAVHSGPAGYRRTARGSVAVTKDGAGHTRGRWEIKVKAKEWETATDHYAMRIELVPAGTLPTACGDSTITLARWTGLSSPTTVGIRVGATRWTRTVSLANNNNFHTFAVELTDTLLTWFVDGKPVARLTSSQAPEAFGTAGLVPRFVLGGKSGVPMTHTRMEADWVRWFTLDRAGKALPTTTPAPTKAAAVSGEC
jgi:hypothetical protein